MIFVCVVVFLLANFDFPIVTFQYDPRAATAVFPVPIMRTFNVVETANSFLELASHAAIDYDVLAKYHGHLCWHLQGKQRTNWPHS